MRRASWARTRFSSTRRGESRASRIASGVTSWKTIRCTSTDFSGFRSCSTCQLIDSPSRSSSVASSRASAPFKASFRCLTYFFLSAGTT